MILTTKVEQDSITAALSESFSYEFSGETSFTPPPFELPKTFSIGMVGRGVFSYSHEYIGDRP